jgi:hypothetical protein|tara:strand:- start:9 stop:377 length:369 start_codon:yes stop_codon:yes gene_type:complete
LEHPVGDPRIKAFPNDRDAMAQAIYQNIYCPRDDMENRINDCQFDLFGRQTSAHGFKPNQLLLIFAGFATCVVPSRARRRISQPNAKARRTMPHGAWKVAQACHRRNQLACDCNRKHDTQNR